MALIAMVVSCSSEIQQPSLDENTQEISAQAFGFALVNSAGTSIVSARSYNSASGAITVQRLGNYYELTFEDLGDDGGVALVVAHGSDNVRCKVVALAKSGSDQIVYYLCHEPDGTETSSAAVVQYFRDAGVWSTTSAYVYANSKSLPFQYCPNSSTFNSTSGDNCITKTSTGTYDVILEDLGELAGSVEVSAVGTDAAYCNVASWGPPMGSPSDQKVVVKCYDETGTLIDSEFMLGYHGDLDVSYNGLAGSGAYAWANNASSSSYTPNTSYSHNAPADVCSNEPNITAGKASQGVYFLDFDLKPLEHSAVHVTAFDTTGYCKLAEWDGTPNGGLYDVEISVLCFDSDGDAADASYVGTYATELTVSPCL
jgi:hypothetical protein